MDAPSPPSQPSSRGPSSRWVVFLAVLAALYTLHAAAALVLPILIALLLALVLAPVVRVLRRCRIPSAVAAALVTMTVVASAAWGIEMLAAPAAEWLGRAPQSLRQLERKLRPMKEPVEQVKRATEQMQKLAGSEDSPRTVHVRSFDLGSVFVSGAGMLAAQIVVVVFLLFFLLASGSRLARCAGRLPRDRPRRKRMFAVARRIKRDVASYFGIITLINFGMGLTAGLTMVALGMPNPALWGAMTALLNYIPYAGAFLTVIVVAMVGLLSFDEVWRGLLPAAMIVLLHVLESNLVTPMLIGRRLTLPPLMVFLSLTIWTWMWGIAGAVLAVPLLIIFKVMADYVEALHPIAPFLGGTGRRRV